MRVPLHAEVVEQAVDMVGEAVEGVGELVCARHVGVAEAGVVGRDDVIAVGQRRDQVAVHDASWPVCRAAGPLRGRGRAGLAVEDPAAGDLGEPVVRDHC